MKKIIIYILIFLIMLSCVFIAINLKSRELSKEEFITLMNSFNKVLNCKIEETAIEKDPKGLVDDKIINKSITYKKDEFTATINENNNYTNFWSNSKTKELIRYMPSDKIYVELNSEDILEVDNSLENGEYKFIRI